MVLEVSKEFLSFYDAWAALETGLWQNSLLLGFASALMQARWGPKPER